MAVSGCDPGPSLKACDRLGREQQDETGSGDPCVEHGYRLQVTTKRLYPPHGQEQPILLTRLSEDLATARVQSVHERQGQLL